MGKIRVNLMTCARVPTAHGEFQLCLFSNSLDEKEHLALVYGEVDSQEDVYVRLHSECFTGDVLGSERCDCGQQLDAAMKEIVHQGRGVIVYLRQEGRGIGLLDKLRAYNLQDEGYDTVEANLLLGHHPDERDYSVAAVILDELNLLSVRVLTNNPEKIEALRKAGITVKGRVPIPVQVTKDNAEYLETKRRRMNHLLPENGLPTSTLSLELDEHSNRSA